MKRETEFGFTFLRIDSLIIGSLSLVPREMVLSKSARKSIIMHIN